jgi:hypothetical protein
MDQEERDNWQRILESLEESGNRDSGFYQRAKAICNGDPDPLIEMEKNS